MIAILIETWQGTIDLRFIFSNETKWIKIPKNYELISFFSNILLSLFETITVYVYTTL